MSSSSDSSLSLFFPLSRGGLNKQQFISDILQPQISKGTSLTTRSGLARAIYDDDLPKQTIKGLDNDTYKRIINLRKKGRENLLSFNANFHQEFEESYGAIKESNPFEQAKYNRYVKFMTNLGTSELAVMQPFVKLIYRYRDNKGQPWKELVMPFPSFTTEEEFLPVLSSKFARGDGSGIENASVERQFPQFGNFLHVTANVNYYFQNLGILTRPQNFPGLNLPTPFTFLKVMALLPQETEQLVLEYGYSLNTKFTDPSIIPRSIQEEILRRERKRFVIKYMSHNFSIEQNGSVRLSVSYTSQQDFDLLKESSDISLPANRAEISFLSPEGDTSKKLLNQYARKRKERIDLEKRIRKSKLLVEKRSAAAKITGTGQKSTDITKLEKQKNKLVEQLKRLNVEIKSIKEKLSPVVKPSLVDSMISHMDVFKISFETETADPEKDGTRIFDLNARLSLVTKDGDNLKDVKLFDIPTSFSTDTFNEDNPTLDAIEGRTKAQKLSILDTLVGTAFNAPKGLTSATSKKKKYGDIVFFSVRSIIAAAYRQLAEDDRKAAQYTSLGNINARSLGKDYTINMGDVLVELNYFQKWFYENYTKKNRIIYTIGDFINDIMKKLIPGIIESNSIEIFGKTRVGSIERTNYLTELRPEQKDTKNLFKSLYYTTNKSALRNLASKVRRTSETKTSKDLKSFIHYSLVKNPSAPIGSAYLKRNLSGTNFKEDNDIQFGCPHIKIGADDGLLKNISFSAQDFPGLRTALWAENLTDSAENLLRYYYTANVETIGNNVFFKGGFFGIPPNLLGIENDDFDPGISGYYAIQKVSDSIGLGNYSTNIEGTWTYNPRTDKSKGGESIKEGENQQTDIPPTKITLSVVEYLENLLRLDPSILAKYGISPDFKLLPTPPPEQPQGTQRDNEKDIKENF